MVAHAHDATLRRRKKLMQPAAASFREERKLRVCMCLPILELILSSRVHASISFWLDGKLIMFIRLSVIVVWRLVSSQK